MKFLTIENKAASLTLDEQIDEYSRRQLMSEIDYAFNIVDAKGRFTNSAETAVDTLNIDIHSPGGSVFDGYLIHSKIMQLRAKGVYVTATVSLAASMASVICMACNEVIMQTTGRMMIHDVSMGLHGNAKELSKAAAMCDELSTEIAKIYASRTGKTTDEMRSMMMEETWMNADKCVLLGFANRILDNLTNSVMVSSMSLLDRLTNPSAQESIDKIAALENVIAIHETELGTYQAELLEARNAITELATIKQNLTTAQNSLATSLDAVKFANSEIETLKAKVTELETSVPAQAVALAATAGITAPLDIENGSQPIDHLEHMKNLSPAERTAYFIKHKKEIKAQRNK
jgi:ATP-dependent protease ClpP protease subunit